MQRAYRQTDRLARFHLILVSPVTANRRGLLVCALRGRQRNLAMFQQPPKVEVQTELPVDASGDRGHSHGNGAAGSNGDAREGEVGNDASSVPVGDPGSSRARSRWVGHSAQWVLMYRMRANANGVSSWAD